ncbi:hypothetical protein U8D42_03270 [Mycobacterium europaeum]|uniref:hypothetical protein n=1 Tax=Mycobacterium europaeum TaxID=761804 RepID=UPI002ADF0F66|nr:hypothetical protein [Mycobacterium europaeum]MEA1159421.1 hypothetical protein [Mycobacterium europaeum]
MGSSTLAVLLRSRQVMPSLPGPASAVCARLRIAWAGPSWSQVSSGQRGGDG